MHQTIEVLENANYVTHSHTPKLDMLLHLQSLFWFSRFVKLYEIPFPNTVRLEGLPGVGGYF